MRVKSKSPTICLDRRACAGCFSVKNSQATHRTCEALLNQMLWSAQCAVENETSKTDAALWCYTIRGRMDWIGMDLWFENHLLLSYLLLESRPVQNEPSMNDLKGREHSR